MKEKTIFLSVIFMITALLLPYPVFPQQEEEQISLGKYKILASKMLKENRRILVHLPRDYEKSKRKYPVFYMLYGDHTTTYFAEVVSVLDRLGPTGRIPEMILIGLENTDRYRDLLPQYLDGKATGIENFLAFFIKEFIPYVENTYRCKKFRLILGPQAGANFVFYSLFKHPELFHAAIINNPFRWRGGRELILNQAMNVLKKDPSYKKSLFITYDDSDQLEREGIKFISSLGVRSGLKTIFADYPLKENTEINGLTDLKNHFLNLSQIYDYQVEIPEHFLVTQYDKLKDQRKTREATEILDFILQQNPQSGNGLWRKVNVHIDNGNLPEAIECLEMMMKNMGSDSGMIRGRVDRLKKMMTESAAYALQKEILINGIKSAKKKYLIIKKDKKIYLDEGELNRLGYQLLEKGKVDEAIFVLKINVENFPKSANAYDSLGEAYFTAGKYQEAKKSYQKNLKLNPTNNHAKEMLTKIINIEK